MILAFDTSGKDLHLGLFDPALQCIGEFHYIAAEGERGVHDSLLAEQTSSLLKQANVKVHQLQRIGFITGPGSFTGLRIGLAFAKGLAFDSQIKLVPVLLHTVLAASAKKQYPSTSFDGIITNGYEPSSIYYASFAAPEKIMLRPLTDVEAESLSIIVDKTAASRINTTTVSQTIVPFDLQRLAELTLHLPEADISTLEPFYGSDFKVTTAKPSP